MICGEKDLVWQHEALKKRSWNKVKLAWNDPTEQSMRHEDNNGESMWLYYPRANANSLIHANRFQESGREKTDESWGPDSKSTG